MYTLTDHAAYLISLDGRVVEAFPRAHSDAHFVDNVDVRHGQDDDDDEKREIPPRTQDIVQWHLEHRTRCSNICNKTSPVRYKRSDFSVVNR